MKNNETYEKQSISNTEINDRNILYVIIFIFSGIMTFALGMEESIHPFFKYMVLCCGVFVFTLLYSVAFNCTNNLAEYKEGDYEHERQVYFRNLLLLIIIKLEFILVIYIISLL